VTNRLALFASLLLGSLFAVRLAAAAPPAPSPAPADTMTGEAEFKVFEADLGQTWINVSAYPPEQQTSYALFSQRCCKCHTLARPINSTLQTDQWEAYVSRMIHKPGSGISPKEGDTILSFLLYDSKQRARKSAIDPELVPFLGVSKELCGVDRFPACLRDIRPEEGVLRVKVTGDSRADLSRLFPNDAGQKLVKWSRRAANEGELVLADASLPGDPGPDAAALAGAPAVQAAVTDAIGNEKKPRERVELLLDWMDEEMKRDYRAGTADAAAVLADRHGDATEYTRLFVAMARAAGIPARPQVGWVARRTAFYLHTWAEVWLGGWVEVDPYLGQLPADLTHVRFTGPDAKAVVEWKPAKVSGLQTLQFRVSTPDSVSAEKVAKGG
jgi:hypothetical protein